MRRIVPDDKLPDLLNHASSSPYPIELAVHLMLHAGLRVGELSKLAWCDLLYDDRPLSTLRLDRHMTKRHQSRELPINVCLRDVIDRTWLLARKTRSLIPSSGILCLRPEGNPVTVRTIQRRLEILGRKAGLVRLNPHMLRHTFATRLMRVTNASVVQMALGHKRLTTTQQYCHPNNEDLREAIDRIPPDATRPLPGPESPPLGRLRSRTVRTPEKCSAELDPLPPQVWHLQDKNRPV